MADQAATTASVPEASLPEAPGIFKGAPVIIRGLQGAAEHNGKKGVVTSGQQGNGRFEVTIQQENEAEAKVLALKPANFQLDTDALKEYLMKKRAEQTARKPALEDNSIMWMKKKGLSLKSLTTKQSPVPELEQGKVLLRVDKFAFSAMSIGYLMKGFTRTFSAYHSFYESQDEGCYRSGCWGYATVVESDHPKVAVGTRLYGLLPPSKYTLQAVNSIIPPGKKGEPSVVELALEGVPFNLRRFQEFEVVDAKPGEDTEFEDWKIATKEIYTMAFYMDENLLVDTGMINSVIISCASSKTALALAFVLRMRDMRYVVGLTSKDRLDFVKSTDLYHEVFTYEDVEKLPNDRTIVYIDIKCDGAIRQVINLRMGTNLMYSMVVGPAVFAKKMKDQVFEKKAREMLFDEASWRERRRMVAEVTKTGRNEKLKYSYKSYVERMKKYIKLKHVGGFKEFKKIYDTIYENTAACDETFICNMHDEDTEVDEIFA